MPTTQVATEIEILRTDLTELDIDAIVYYARPDLELGSGFGTAISIRGGPSIKEELDGKGPVETGEVVVTSAGKLKSRHIIHAVGPRFLEPDLEQKLRKTVLNCLEAAEKAGARSIGFPPMGTGFYGIPLDLSARVMIEAIEAYIEDNHQLERIAICVLDSRELEPFKQQVAKRPGGSI